MTKSLNNDLEKAYQTALDFASDKKRYFDALDYYIEIIEHYRGEDSLASKAELTELRNAGRWSVTMPFPSREEEILQRMSGQKPPEYIDAQVWASLLVLKSVHLAITSQLETISWNRSKLHFDHHSGQVVFRKKSHTLSNGTKARAFLSYIEEHRNRKVEFYEIEKACNKLLKARNFFTTPKQIDDVIRGLRLHLSVKNGELFPIRKLESNSWIWSEVQQ